MSTWVLIIAILTMDGNAITTQEFSSEDNCLAAAMVIKSNLQPIRLGKTKMECVKK